MDEMKKLWADARELSLGTSGSVDRLVSPPSPLRFLRDYVSANKPCIISRSGTTTHWPAISLWTDDAYLRKSLADRTVSVHLTPDGRADSLAPLPGHTDSLCFASAAVRQIPFSHALRLISSPPDSIVAYAQQQDDCFRSEYSPLAGDVDDHISWASDALGRLPEAVNLWIGGSFSETSFHKDHYENLYAVVTGEKHFLLLPPTEVHRLYIRSYPAASYIDEGEELRLEVEVPERLVPWCSVDPYPRTIEDMEKQRMSFPLYFEGPSPFECTVKAGEILYLPSMWFHHVRQTPDSNGRTIAVNYWYDMQFDMKYAYFNFLQSIELPPHNGSSQQLLENHQGYSDSQINSPGKDDDDSESEVQADSVNVDMKCSKASNQP